jgi:iron complex transport system substrate-binding protein
LTDDEGVETALGELPERIVTFSPSNTEIVFALGLGDRLVGVSGPDDDYPPQAAGLEAVAASSSDQPDVAEVASLRPDVVLTNTIGGEWKERLRELDIPVFTTLASSLEDGLSDMGTLGRLLGAQAEANEAISRVALGFGEVQERLKDSEPVSCFLDLGGLRSVGPGSLEFDLLRKAGCKPITSGAREAYPRWTAKGIEEGDPDVYLLAEGQPPAEARTGRVTEVDAALISRPGPRMTEGIEALAAALHGEVEA